MSSEEKHSCSVANAGGVARWDFGGHQCPNNAKYEEGGKWYCGLHLPSKIEARRQADRAKGAEQAAKRQKTFEKVSSAVEALRKAGAYSAWGYHLNQRDVAGVLISPEMAHKLAALLEQEKNHG